MGDGTWCGVECHSLTIEPGIMVEGGLSLLCEGGGLLVYFNTISVADVGITRS